MTSDAGGQEALAAAEHQILASIGRRDFRAAAGQLSQLADRFEPLITVADEICPALDALDAGHPIEAFFRPSLEATTPSELRNRLLAVTAEDLEHTQHELLAAAAWDACQDLGHRRKSHRILHHLQIDTPTLQNRVRRLAMEHYRKRVTTTPDNAVAWECLALLQWQAEDRRSAYESGTRAATLDPARPDAVRVVARILAFEGRLAEAVQWVEGTAAARPDSGWAWFLLAELQADHQPDAALQASLQAIQLDPSLQGLASLHRTLLRTNQHWSELAEHLEGMIGETLHMEELSELHAELGELLIKRLNQPVEGLTATQRADWFKDRTAVAAWYWQTLSETGDDPAVWSEVEEFFTVNALWADLARLLVRKLDFASEDQILPLLDELAAAYENEPAGRESYRFVLKKELTRTTNASLRAELERRLGTADTVRPRPPVTTKTTPIPWVWVIGFVVCAFVGSLVALLLIALTWGIG